MFVLGFSQQIALAFALVFFALMRDILRSLFEKTTPFIGIVEIPMEALPKDISFPLKGIHVILSRLFLFFKLQFALFYLLHFAIDDGIAVLVALVRNGRTSLSRF
jgi:hypothetical protein